MKIKNQQKPTKTNYQPTSPSPPTTNQQSNNHLSSFKNSSLSSLSHSYPIQVIRYNYKLSNRSYKPPFSTKGNTRQRG